MSATFSHTGASVKPPLLGPDEPLPYSIVNPDGKAKCLLICDHASNYIPEKLQNLGLPAEELGKHAAVDIGAKDAAIALSAQLDAPLIMANYSRMAVDLNRRLDHPTIFPTTSEGVPVPGNLSISKEDETLRIDEIYRPYHEKIGAMVDNYIQNDIIPAIVSIHSLTPVFFGQKRPWEIGVLWVQDPRIPVPLMEGLRGKGYKVGDNEPYDCRILRGATMHMHADGRHLPNVLIEYRNDLLLDSERQKKLISDTAEILQITMDDPALYRLYDGPQVPHDLELEYEYFKTEIKTAHHETE